MIAAGTATSARRSRSATRARDRSSQAEYHAQRGRCLIATSASGAFKRWHVLSSSRGPRSLDAIGVISARAPRQSIEAIPARGRPDSISRVPLQPQRGAAFVGDFAGSARAARTGARSALPRGLRWRKSRAALGRRLAELGAARNRRWLRTRGTCAALAKQLEDAGRYEIVSVSGSASPEARGARTVVQAHRELFAAAVPRPRGSGATASPQAVRRGRSIVGMPRTSTTLVERICPIRRCSAASSFARLKRAAAAPSIACDPRRSRRRARRSSALNEHTSRHSA
jgi:hypothetical protein